MKNLSLTLSLSALCSLSALVSCASKQEVASAPDAEISMVSDSDFGRLPAADCDPRKYKECKEARSNDVADRYFLGKDGTLSRRIKDSRAICAVTGGVSDFKISQHPQDVAVVYYKKKNNLYMINVDREATWSRRGNCPSAEGNTFKLMNDVSKYTVTSNTDSTIVNVALDKYGKLAAWDNRTIVYQDSNVKEFLMNDCFGSQGRSFNSYVLFTRDRSGIVTKVKVNKSILHGNIISWSYLKDESRDTQGHYSSISDFKAAQRVCR